MKNKQWAAYPVTVEISVRWRDLDPYNHVNNSVYLNFFEEARVALYKRLPSLNEANPALTPSVAGGKIRDLMSLNAEEANPTKPTASQDHSFSVPFNSTLVRTSIEFRSQAFLGDLLIVGIRITNIKKMFLTSEYALFNKDTGQLLATGSATQAAIDRKYFKPIRIPANVIKDIENLQNMKF